MKQFNAIKILMFALLILVCSCEHLNFSMEEKEVLRWRISKISSNKNMEHSKVFTYNSDGLLILVSPDEFDSPLYFIYHIEYDESNKPVSVTESMYLNETVTETISKIEWTENGFVISNEHEGKEKYKIDENNRIININDEMSFEWYGKDSLRIESIAKNKIEEYKFIKYNHPLSGINLAIIYAAQLNFCDWNEWQNQYCISGWNKCGECSGKIFYSINEWNYPTEMRKRIESKYGVSYQTLYFEYESY